MNNVKTDYKSIENIQEYFNKSYKKFLTRYIIPTFALGYLALFASLFFKPKYENDILKRVSSLKRVEKSLENITNFYYDSKLESILVDVRKKIKNIESSQEFLYSLSEKKKIERKKNLMLLTGSGLIIGDIATLILMGLYFERKKRRMIEDISKIEYTC